jgi:predicted dehydrogenase
MNGDNLEKIKIIVIGLGKIGLHYAFDDKRKQPASHIAAIMNNPNLKLVGVCDPDKKSLEKFHKKYDKKIISEKDHFKLIEQLGKKEIDFDIIVIATPEKTHFEVLKFCISKISKTKTKKIIFCEKPMTQNLTQAKKIKKMLKNPKINIVINHSRRWSKAWQEAFELKSEIGKLEKAGFYFATSPENKSISQIRDGIHIADILSWFKIEKITTINRLNLNYFLYDFHIWGSEGKIEIVNFGTELKMYKKKKSEHFEGFYELKPIFKKKINESYLKNVYQEFVEHFKKNKILTTNFNDGLKAMESFEEYVYVKNLRR